MDSELNLNGHIKTIAKSAYYHLKTYKESRDFCQSQMQKNLLNLFIFNRLDYCNVFFKGLRIQ